MTIKSLENTTPDQIFESFRSAFFDYEMQLSKTELHAMIHRRGFNASLSFGAFHGNDLVAFTLNGTGGYNGVKTAYDTGTGTIKAYRGQGLASQIFTYSIPHLQGAGIKRYLLEVLQYNDKAISVYTKLGFKVVREFNYFSQKKEQIKTHKTIEKTDWTRELITIEKLNDFQKFWDFMPSWQNSIEAISRKPDNFIMLGALENGEAMGYCIFEPDSGDITQIAVDNNNRRRGVATSLLCEVLKHNRHHQAKAINTQMDCKSITSFLESFNFPIKGTQFEMIRNL
ncbi:MAG: GNAT family N-acetyltransferase [Bacteroidales bacterium]|nr:GNAT family N-acetyltransferase [Bacteroidales bacterium]